MNRYDLVNLNRRVFSDVQLEVVRLNRGNGTFKEWFNPYLRIAISLTRKLGRRTTTYPPFGLARISATLVSNEGIFREYQTTICKSSSDTVISRSIPSTFYVRPPVHGLRDLRQRRIVQLWTESIE